MAEEEPFPGHFAERWKERGDRSVDAYRLMRVLNEEYLMIRGGGQSAIMTFVQDNEDQPGVGYFRFLIRGVPFYAVINKHTGRLITVYDQAMMRRKKAKKKQQKRWRSMAGKVGRNARGKG